jgi:TonB family protein
MKINSRIIQGINPQFKVPIKARIASWVEKMVIEARYRISGSFTFSLVIHILLTFAYFGLLELDQPVEPPIREITFVDMTEPPPPPPEESIKRKQHRIQPQVFPTQPPPTSDVQNQVPPPATSSPLVLGNDRLFLDSPRKQAPINVHQVEPVGDNVAQTGDMIKISQAIGIKNDDQISKPSISLADNNNVRLTSPSSSQGAVSFSQSSQPQIDLKTSGISGPITATTPSSGDIGQASPPPEKQDKPVLAPPRETQTTITGELANRKIVKKVIPPFPKWAKRQGVGASIALQFTVMENGVVKENVIVVRTSGSREWDALVIEALKSWEFAALENIGRRQDQTGVITFQFVI